MRFRRGARGFAILLAVTASSLVVIGSSAGAETTASLAAGPVGVGTTVDGPDRNDVVTITVPIDVVPGTPELANAARTLARTWERQIETGWNNAFEFFSYKCFTLRLDADIKVRRVGFEGSDDRHRVIIATAGSGTPGFEGTKERNPSLGSKDGTRAFDGVRDGIWREDQSEAVTLHEVGHLFGLGDDYEVVVDPTTGKPVEPRQTKPIPGRQGTLMGDGGVIDPALVDRIGAQIEKLLDGLPGCEVWEGTMNHTVTSLGPGAGSNPCGSPQRLPGAAMFYVSRNGTVAGTYDVTGCGVSEPHAEFTGTVDEDGFTFPQLIVQTNGELIPKVGPKRARARLTNLQGTADGGALWVTAWDMRCTSC